MGLELDPEVLQALAPVLTAMLDVTPPPAGDWKSRRVAVEGLMGSFMKGLPSGDEVGTADHTATAEDGTEIPMRLYTRAGESGGALVVYLHGGGMIMGSVELYDPVLRFLASRSGVALLSVDYRVAPEFPHPTPVEDCYAALRWAAEHAVELGYDPARIAVAGDSAGGGLAAATALVARDCGGPALAGQILVYPMLDDRNVVAPANASPVQMWSYDDNVTGWNALLGEAAGTDDVSPYAAPARADDLAGLPRTYLVVGDMDIFRDEDIAYAGRLSNSGVPVEFHLVPGAPHGFDFLAPASAISQRAYADEVRALQSI